MKRGDIVFFTEAKTNTLQKTKPVHFKGHGYGLNLGIVPLLGKQPDTIRVMIELSSCGLFHMNDIQELMGEEAAQAFLQKFKERYFKPMTVEPAPQLELPIEHD